MPRKLSYSQASNFILCSKYWHNQYVERLESSVIGASLPFGSAIDGASTKMLEGKEDWLETFYDLWKTAYSYGVRTPVWDNPEIVYSAKDFDGDILESKDIPVMEGWGKELNLLDANITYTQKELVSIHKTIAKKKRNPYQTVTVDEMKFYNRLNWLSMKRKGKLLLEAFKVQFLPKVTKVLALQQRATITDNNTQDSIVGVIDAVLQIEGRKDPVIFDLKTSGQPYEQENMELTQQLLLYLAMKGQEFNTKTCGYIVLPKVIPKNEVSICKSCGNTRTSGHKSCEAIINGKRCSGIWDTKLVPNVQVQVMIEEKTEAQINEVLIDYGNISMAMDNGIVYKNTERCNNWYGSVCPYKKFCWEKDSTGLKKKGSV